MTLFLRRSAVLISTLLLGAAEHYAAETLKRASFDADPGWEGINNRVIVETARSITQDFGFSATTKFVGGEPGEIGGRITRASQLASYAVMLPARTLHDKFSASGAFTFTETGVGGGVAIGFFLNQQPETARPTNSLTMQFGTENAGGRLAVRLITAKNETCGKFVTHFTPGGFRPTPLRKGQRYGWQLDYDPDGAGGLGEFSFSLSGHNSKDPVDSPITVPLTAGFKEQGTTFNRFGLLNIRKAGGSLALYIDDLIIDGRHWDFASDPKWEGIGNRLTYLEADAIGAHQFGYSATKNAAGQAGEVGGTVWRSTYASYGDAVGPFSLDQPLVACGRLAFTAADPDSGVCLGWYRSGPREDGQKGLRDFVGVHIEGPTRVGHYFAPRLATAQGTKAAVDKGPVLLPDAQPRAWAISYDPAANGGRGTVTVTLDQQTVTLNLRDKVKAEGATLNRFGLFSPAVGGSKVKIWLDDLEYTAR